MPARTIRVILHNETPFSLNKIEDHLDHGEWTNPWRPPQKIFTNTVAEWRSESGGDIPVVGSVGTGTEGNVRYNIDDGHNSSIYIHWNNPFAGTNKYHQHTNEGYELFHTGGSGDDAEVIFFIRTTSLHTANGFRPSINGFQFGNSWGNVPYSLPPLKGSPLDFKYGNAKNGLCGGMVYAVRDYFEAGKIVPQDRIAPTGEQSPLFRYIVNRLFDSFTLNDITLYLKLMDPLYPFTDENILNPVNAADGRAFVIANIEWPLIRQDILSGHPSPMGLVTVLSFLPFDLGSNHQVLAYAYQASGDNVDLWVYDPNSPQEDKDNIKLSFNIRTTAERIFVVHNVAVSDPDNNHVQRPIYCFFRTNYSPKKPPFGAFSLRLYCRIKGINPTTGIRLLQLTGTISLRSLMSV
jgi:hypothetical protein